MTERSTTPMLLAHPFRPFFLLTGVYGVLVVLAWFCFLFAGLTLPLGWSPLQWHSHEMLYGLIPAAIAGFVLTAMCNWTGARPLQDGGLLALILLWLMGRLVMWLAGWLPAWLVALVDLAFLPVLAVYVTRILLHHGNRRNLILVAVLAMLFMGNLLMHIGFVSGDPGWLRIGQQQGLDLIMLLMVIIAGRIIPAFTANWLRNAGGDADRVFRSPWTDRLAITGVVLLIPLGWWSGESTALGVVALLAAMANALRLVQWRGWLAAREPLLWILHLAYFWIVSALLLRGIAAFTPVIPDNLWQHLLGVGAMGTLILGVMTRVAMGHTGRPLKLPKYGLAIYIAIIAATVLRVLAAAHLMDYRLGVSLAALFWVLAFGLFVILYLPILARPRADGRPG